MDEWRFEIGMAVDLSLVFRIHCLRVIHVWIWEVLNNRSGCFKRLCGFLLDASICTEGDTTTITEG
jgi:hypothetical protein